MSTTINGGIVWSRSRRRAWNQCQRRYLLRYHGEAPEREACRPLISEGQWAAQVFFDGVHEAIISANASIRSLDANQLARHADRRITAQWSRSRKGEPLLAVCTNDSKNTELHAIPSRVRERVRGWFTRFCESEVLTRLLATSPALRRPPSQHRQIDVGGIAVAPTPLWSRLDGEGLVFSAWSMTKQPPADASEWATAALLACQHTGIAPDRIRVEAAHLNSDAPLSTFYFDAALLIEEQNRILEDTADWQHALSQGEAGFPANPHPEACRECSFLAICPEGQIQKSDGSV